MHQSRVPSVGPAWVVPLGGLVELDAPITRTQLNERYGEVLAILEATAEQADGAAYAPFQNYGGKELRAQQGYLTKFPAALVDLLFPLDGSAYETTRPASRGPRTPRAGVGQGYLADAEKRSALERHAVDLAKSHYVSMGAAEIVELGKPYDLRVTLDGLERHVEVKGSSGVDVGSVQLTQGEVVHAASWPLTDLVVVDGIECWRDETGSVQTSGGSLRIWQGWIPSPSHLTPTHLRYELPT